MADLAEQNSINSSHLDLNNRHPNDTNSGLYETDRRNLADLPANTNSNNLNSMTSSINPNSNTTSLPNFSDRLNTGLVKLLVPAYAAGAIIGKQGSTISELQKQTGVSIKLSKPKDFYPGTLERICLVQGKVDGLSVNDVVKFIVNKIHDFPIPKELLLQNSDRPKQVKIIVPNSTAGLIIGKKGATIKHIMETSKAKVQMTQKPESLHMQPLLERVITIVGDLNQLHIALDQILEKIKDDPQSGSCPNLSYANVTGLIANANPIGSPYAPVNKNQLLSAVNRISLANAAINQASSVSGSNLPTLNLITNSNSLPINSAIQNLNISGGMSGSNSGLYTVFQ